MNPGGDAAEEVVKLYLEGFEVAARLSGAAAKDVALLLVSVLKEQTKTKGKARLTSMLRSGKELKVFTLPQRDLQKFTQEAKRYGVLYCVLREKGRQEGSAPVDIIARADDASKIQRIVERFQLGTIDKATIVAEAQNRIAERGEPAKEEPERTRGERITEEAVTKEKEEVNPSSAKTDKGPLSKQDSRNSERTDKGELDDPHSRPSVRKKIQKYIDQAESLREAARSEMSPEIALNQTLHRQPVIKKEKGITK